MLETNGASVVDDNDLQIIHASLGLLYLADCVDKNSASMSDFIFVDDKFHMTDPNITHDVFNYPVNAEIYDENMVILRETEIELIMAWGSSYECIVEPIQKIKLH
ncbi:hypothetical protein ACTXT7_003232 [Hymenolepis weldensis]